MSFKKMVGAVMVGNLIGNAIYVGLTVLEKANKKRRRRRAEADCEGHESIYSGKKSDGPYARKIGFGAND